METPQYHFTIYNSIILAGIIQGLIFGLIVAFSKKYRSTSTLLLATLIVVFSLNNTQYYLASTWLVRNRYLYGITWTPGQLVMAPLLYFYGLKLLYPEKAIPKKTIILLLTPFALGVLAVNYLKFTYNYLENKIIYLQLEALMELISIFLTFYVVIRLFFKIRKYNREAALSSDLKILPKVQWFRNIVVTFFFLCIIWLIITTMMVLEVEGYYDFWNFIWIAIAVMIYWLGHVGIYKYGIEEERKKIRSHTLERSSIIVVDKQKSEHLALFENMIVQQKLFLDPEITQDKVAEALNISKSHFSRLINNELGTSFPEYINQLRVKEAKYYLKHPDFANYTLVSIGLEAGFASKTTFNNTFKKVTGMTPSEYKNDGSIPLEG